MLCDLYRLIRWSPATPAGELRARLGSLLHDGDRGGESRLRNSLSAALGRCGPKPSPSLGYFFDDAAAEGTLRNEKSG